MFISKETKNHALLCERVLSGRTPFLFLRNSDEISLKRFLKKTDMLTDIEKREIVEEPIYRSSMECFSTKSKKNVDHIKRERCFNKNKRANQVRYSIDIFSQDRYRKSQMLLRNDFLTLLCERLNIDVSNVDINKFSDYIFRYHFYKDIIKVLVNSISKFSSAHNVFLNKGVFEYVLKRSFENGNGMVFETYLYMEDKINICRQSISETLKKLEYMGISDLVVSNKPHFVEDEKKNRNYLKMSLFPCLNYRLLAAYIIPEYCDEIVGLINNVLKNNDFLLMEKEVGEKKKGVVEKIKIKHCKEFKVNNTNLYTRFYNKFKTYLHKEKGEKYGFFKFPKVIESKINNFFKDKKNINSMKTLFSKINVTVDDWIDGMYSMNIWIKDMFYYFTGSDTNVNTMKDILEEDKKRVKFVKYCDSLFDDCSKFFSMYSHEENFLSEFFRKFITYQKFGIIETWKFNTDNVKKYNTYKSFFGDDKKRIVKKFDGLDCNIYTLQKEFLNEILNQMIDDFGDRKDINTYVFPVFMMVKKLYSRVDDKVNFVFDVYETFVGKNKSPVYMMKKFQNFLIKYKKEFLNNINI